MSALDTGAGVAFGCFLVAVAVNGRSADMLAQAKKDRAFLKWGVSVAILAYIYRLPNMAAPVSIIIAAAFLGLFLKNGTKISKQSAAFWQYLSGEQK